MSALLGFYLLVSLILAEDLDGHSLIDNLWRELWANRIYLASGLLSGPLFGALGARWQTTRLLNTSVVAGAVMVGEPTALTLFGVLVPATRVGLDAIRIAVYATEAASGLAVLLVALAWSMGCSYGRNLRPSEPSCVLPISAEERQNHGQHWRRCQRWLDDAWSRTDLVMGTCQ